jgi:hypothetical protein
MIPSADNQLAALREEIRQAVRPLLWFRAGARCSWGAVIMGGALGGYLSLLLPGAYWGPRGPYWSFQLFVALVAGGLLCALGIVYPLRCTYLSRRRRELRNRLAELEPEERATLLRPLAAMPHANLHDLVGPLLKELPTAPSEVLPASAPTGSGGEASPTE